MKEAAGEANLTVITIVLIALVLGVGTVVVNNALKNAGISAACTTVGGNMHGGVCYDETNKIANAYTCQKLSSAGHGCEAKEYCCWK